MIDETLIDKYFSKSLTIDESLEFEKLYDTDAEFKQEVDFLKDLKSVSETEDDAQFKDRLIAFEAEYPEQNNTLSNHWWKPLIAVAAAVLIILSINFFMNSSIDEAHLFSSYFEPSKNVTAPIVRSDGNETSLNKAFIAYGEADYIEALSLFGKAYENSKNSTLLFYQGNAFLALDDTENAIAKFEAHLKYSDALTNRSHWYLALAYMKTKQLEKAKQELNLLINSGETFKTSEALLLLKKLE